MPLLGHADCCVYTSIVGIECTEGDLMVNFTLVQRMLPCSFCMIVLKYNV